MELTLAHYRTLPYSRRAEGFHEAGADRYWVVWIDELPGCKTDGATYEEAMANLDVAFDDYIEAMLEFGTEIAVPKKLSETATVHEVHHEVPEAQIRATPILELAENLNQGPGLSNEVTPWHPPDDTTTATKSGKVAAQVVELEVA